MKKIILSTILTLCFCSASFAADYYLVGVDAFKKGSYDKAIPNLEHAIRINAKNVNARYYLAQCYLGQKRISDAQNQYERIIFLAPDSDAGILSYKGLSLIKNATPKAKGQLSQSDTLSQYKDNYFDYILNGDGKPIKWASFPIKVYIQPSERKDAVKRAFDKWQSGSNNLVCFKYQTIAKDAQIIVDFKSQLESTSTENSFIAGYSKPYIKNGKMSKSEIHLLKSDPKTGQELSAENVMGTALHEIGHSLGFNGHSPNEKDVMFATSEIPKAELTQRDLNTLLFLYKTDDTTIAKRNKGSTDVKLQQALDYVKRQPDKSVGWVNLGDIYRNKKMYSEAIRNFEKAASIEPDKADIYNLTGLTYIQMGNNENAYTNFKKACDLDGANPNYILSFAKICLQTGRKATGIQYAQKYLKENPDGANDEELQKILLLYK